MNTFKICWLVAGAIVGFSVPQCVLACFKVRTNLRMDIMLAFVGAVIAYTMIK